VLGPLHAYRCCSRTTSTPATRCRPARDRSRWWGRLPCETPRGREPSRWRRVILGKTPTFRNGELPFLRINQRLVRARRADAQSLRHRSQPLRVQLRLGRRGVGQHSRRGSFGSETDQAHRVSRQRQWPSSASSRQWDSRAARGVVPISHTQEHRRSARTDGGGCGSSSERHPDPHLRRDADPATGGVR